MEKISSGIISGTKIKILGGRWDGLEGTVICIRGILMDVRTPEGLLVLNTGREKGKDNSQNHARKNK